MIRELLRTASRKASTTRYPYEGAKVVEGLRARLLCDHGLCIWCGLCVRNCPSKALDISSKPERQLLWHMGRCLLCGLCADVCPVDALGFNQDFELAFHSRDEMTVAINRQKEGE
jgi:formate hydrogenlyase subunit 6/NADH:ubiquinone oxidoreductase subunit I